MQLNLTLICFVFGGFLPDAAARREQMDTGQCDLPRSVSRAGPGRGRAGPRGMRACPRGARGPRGAGGTGARGRIPPPRSAHAGARGPHRCGGAAPRVPRGGARAVSPAAIGGSRRDPAPRGPHGARGLCSLRARVGLVRGEGEAGRPLLLPCGQP